MKFSRSRFYLLIFLAFVVSGGVSCALTSAPTSETSEAMELQGLEGEGNYFGEGEEEGEFADSGDDEGESWETEDKGGEEFVESQESLEELEGDMADDSMIADIGDSLGEGSESSDDLGEDVVEDFGSEGTYLEDDFSGESLTEEDSGELVDDGEELEAQTESQPIVNLTNIQFLVEHRGGAIAITSDVAVDYETRFNSETNQYVVEIPNAFLPDSLRRPFIMKDFKSAPFGAISAYQGKGSDIVSVVVQMKDSGLSPSFEQEGNIIYVLPPESPESEGELLAANDESPVSSDEEVGESMASSGEVDEPESYEEEFYEDEESVFEETSDSGDLNLKVLGARSLEEFLMNNNRFYGRKISLSLSGVDIREAIKFIAEESGANLVLSEQVKGNVYMKLRDVPWDQALITLLRSNRLGYVRQGTVIRISTLQQLQQESQASKSILEAQKALMPLHVRVVPVSYADVEKLSTQLTPFLTPSRGKLVTDPRTSSVIITDTDMVLNRLSALIKRLDLPPEQVMIESRVVEATEAFSRSLGISWGASGIETELGSSSGDPLFVKPSFSIRPAGGFLSFNIGTLDFLGDLDAALELAETDSTARVISSPRIVAINKEASKISQSGEVLSIGTVTQGDTITSKVDRTSVTLSLSVTPQITASGGVIMDVDVQRQFPGAIEHRETLARAVNSRSAKTKVLVQNGETAVIGGIYDTRESQGESGVPVLKDIPVLGWLFKSRSYENRKNELLIFLTPRVMKSKI